MLTVENLGKEETERAPTVVYNVLHIVSDAEEVTITTPYGTKVGQDIVHTNGYVWVVTKLPKGVKSPTPRSGVVKVENGTETVEVEVVD